MGQGKFGRFRLRMLSMASRWEHTCRVRSGKILRAGLAAIAALAALTATKRYPAKMHLVTAQKVRAVKTHHGTAQIQTHQVTAE